MKNPKKLRGEVIPYYDVAVLGDTACGKSSIIERLISGSFTQTYRPTAAEVYIKTIENDDRDKRLACLQIFDTAGGFEFPMILKLTIKKCQAFIVVYSVGSQKSLEMAKKQLREISEIKGRLTPCLLVGNKKDLDYTKEREVSFDMGLQTAVMYGCSFIETSPKINWNIKEVFRSMIKKIQHVDCLKYQLYMQECEKLTRSRKSEKKPRRRSSLTSIKSFLINNSSNSSKSRTINDKDDSSLDSCELSDDDFCI